MSDARAFRGAPWHSGRILALLVERCGYRQNQCFTEIPIDGCQADFVAITQAGFLSEFEVKISASDWRTDKERKRFERPRPHVRQMYYAVPEPLVERCPDFVPSWVGLLVAREGEWSDHLKEYRPAVRQRAQKVDPREVERWRSNCYFRFWSAEYRRLRAQARPVHIPEAAA